MRARRERERLERQLSTIGGRVEEIAGALEVMADGMAASIQMQRRDFDMSHHRRMPKVARGVLLLFGVTSFVMLGASAYSSTSLEDSYDELTDARAALDEYRQLEQDGLIPTGESRSDTADAVEATIARLEREIRQQRPRSIIALTVGAALLGAAMSVGATALYEGLRLSPDLADEFDHSALRRQARRMSKEMARRRPRRAASGSGTNEQRG